MKRKAFTLAEVLITLTIIGVIAALTIPNLMQSYRKHEVEVGIKEAYSILSNAIKIASSETSIPIEDMVAKGGQGSWGGTADEVAEKYFIPYLKLGSTVKCKSNTNGCPNIFPQVKDLNMTTDILNWGAYVYNRFQLANGMQVGMQWHSYGYIRMLVDINGAKGPNRACYDQFYFSFGQEYVMGYLTGGVGSAFELYHYDYSNHKSYDTEGVQCAYFIQKNGWRIPDDYPVKKW